MSTEAKLFGKTIHRLLDIIESMIADADALDKRVKSLEDKRK